MRARGEDLAELCVISRYWSRRTRRCFASGLLRARCAAVSRTEAERFFEQSDGKNVRRVLAHRCPADITITLDSSGRMRRLKATPALAFFDIDGTLTWAREGEADIDAAPTDAAACARKLCGARKPRRALHGPAAVMRAAGTQDVAVCRHGHVGGRARGADGEVVRDVGMPSDVVELLVSCCEQARVPAYFESSSRGVVLAWPVSSPVRYIRGVF